MLSPAFAPQSLEWAFEQPPDALAKAWSAALPRGINGFRLHGSPLLLSAELDRALRERGQQLGRWLQQRALLEGWRDMNVVCADLLLCEGEPWSLGWVEFQAFTSVAAAMDWLHELALPLWPALENFDAHGAGLRPADWRRSYADWVRGPSGKEPIVVLEHQPWNQRTACDFFALQSRFGWPVHEPEALRWQGTRVELEGVPLAGVLNRVVEPQYPLADGAHWQQLCRAEGLHWHSPPWLYGEVNKRLLVDWHRDDPSQAIDAVPLQNWRDLGLPAHALVAKPALGLGGQGVLMQPSAEKLDALSATEPAGSWLVQRRLRPLAFKENADGLPLQIEIRLMLDCSAGQPIRQMNRLGRVSRWGRVANVAHLQGVAGEGVALLLGSF
ncbi:MAG: hypothetical protein ACK5O3_11060 [Burkholderiales bacterium]